MKHQSGFSLMELIVIISIISILTAVATPNVLTWRANLQLGSSARDILGAFQETRMQAIRDQVRTVISFDSIAGTYEAFVDDGGSMAEEKRDYIGNEIRDEDEAIIVNGTLPNNIQITNASFGTNGSINRFDMRGMASFNGNVTLKNFNGEIIKIVVSQSGSARIEN